MALRIEDYALIGDTRTGALVGCDGSIDWLCLPRFDSAGVFAALLGDADNGRWLVAPTGAHRLVGRSYRGETLVLETEFATGTGSVRVIDCMPMTEGEPSQVIRLVEGLSGTVTMRSEVVLRPDYGRALPWLQQEGRLLRIYAGADCVVLGGDEVHRPEGSLEEARAVAQFTVSAGEQVGLRMTWTGLESRPPAVNIAKLVAATERWWTRWSVRCRYDGPYRDAVLRSLITLRALSYDPSGALVAALTTSLPERLGGVRNWDYRYCWLRDATYTLLAFVDGGHLYEAIAWRRWLLRAATGDPEQLQIMYGLNGEHRLPESELGWLVGYAGSVPVRAGNAAHDQRQLDVYGEVMDALHHAREHGLPSDDAAWALQCRLLEVLADTWQQPDSGIWEVRSEPRQFVHSKVMAWVAFDRGVKAVETHGLPGPVECWRKIRQQIFDDVCAQGYDAKRRTFTQSYGSRELDAATLLIPLVGFLPAHDERVRGTVAAVERHLLRDGLVQRYTMPADIGGTAVDGLPPGEGAFLMCSFWLVDNYTLAGRHDDATALFERLLGLANDVGLLAEEYDTEAERLVGNFPQAVSHVALVTAALSLQATAGPAQRRSASTASPDEGVRRPRTALARRMSRAWR